MEAFQCVMGKLTPKLKSNETSKTMWETQSEKFMISKTVNVYILPPGV